MSMKLSNIMAAFALFAFLVGSFNGIYNGFAEAYEFQPNDLNEDGLNVMGALSNLNIVSGMTDIIQALYSIVAPATLADIVGGLLAAGWGVIKLASGLITFIPEILLTISGFYYIPPDALAFFGFIFELYLGFIFLKTSTGQDH